MAQRRRGWFLVVAGIAVALLGVVAASIATVQIWRRYDALAGQGVTATGIITQVWTDTSDPFGFKPLHRIELTFEADGVDRAAVYVVNPRILLQHMQEGDELTVRYIPGHPEINAFAPSWSWINFDQIAWMAEIGVGFVMAGLGLLWRAGRPTSAAPNLPLSPRQPVAVRRLGSGVRRVTGA